MQNSPPSPQNLIEHATVIGTVESPPDWLTHRHYAGRLSAPYRIQGLLKRHSSLISGLIK